MPHWPDALLFVPPMLALLMLVVAARPRPPRQPAPMPVREEVRLRGPRP